MVLMQTSSSRLLLMPSIKADVAKMTRSFTKHVDPAVALW